MGTFMEDFVTFQYDLKYNDSQMLDNDLVRVKGATSWMDYTDILKDYNYTEYFKISGYLGLVYSTVMVCSY